MPRTRSMIPFSNTACSGRMVTTLALVILPIMPLSVPSSLLFGLIGMAPAGVIMALTAHAMKPENRAIGMGLFFSFYFLIQAPAPAIAGWLFDQTANAYWPILFAIVLFFCTALANLAFRLAQKHNSAPSLLIATMMP